jgi:hypothetical protein
MEAVHGLRPASNAPSAWCRQRLPITSKSTARVVKAPNLAACRPSLRERVDATSHLCTYAACEVLGL